MIEARRIIGLSFTERRSDNRLAYHFVQPVYPSTYHGQLIRGRAPQLRVPKFNKPTEFAGCSRIGMPSQNSQHPRYLARCPFSRCESLCRTCCNLLHCNHKTTNDKLPCVRLNLIRRCLMVHHWAFSLAISPTNKPKEQQVDCSALLHQRCSWSLQADPALQQKPKFGQNQEIGCVKF